MNQQAVCSCQREYQGTPPNCRPECVVNNECPSNRACHKFKCSDPCPGTCGLNARCEVINHNPICTCPNGLIGDPFTRCYPQPGTLIVFLYYEYCIKLVKTNFIDFVRKHWFYNRYMFCFFLVSIYVITIIKMIRYFHEYSIYDTKFDRLVDTLF